MNDMTPVKAGEIIEAVIARGDIAQLTPDERAKYYVRVCESVGLNPMTRPFEYITLNGKLTLYARKDCTDQLRGLHGVSVTDLAESERDGVFIVTAKVVNARGRADAAKGAVSLTGLKGEALANALMKAETKAKRRATLSICGLGFLDETEVDDIGVGNGKDKPQTLPKKDARDIYIKMQQEVSAAKSRAALKAWGDANAERIGLLPEDWQDILRMRFQEMMLDLQHRETATEAKADPVSETAEAVVWTEDGERAATADDKTTAKAVELPDPSKPAPVKITPAATTPVDSKGEDVPTFLKRYAKTATKPEPPEPPEPIDGDRWLRGFTADLEGKTSEDLIGIQQTHMSAVKSRLSPEHWSTAADLFRRAMDLAIKREAKKEAFDAAQWLRDLDGALSGCTAAADVFEKIETVQKPAQSKVSPVDYAKGKKLVAAALTRIAADDEA